MAWDGDILVTGGAGFIGAHFVRDWLQTQKGQVVNLDRLTYAGNLQNLAGLKDEARHSFVRGDIGDRLLTQELLARYKPRAIVHFAAETHVDRSIGKPDDFITTNVVGTMHLLEAARAYWQGLEGGEKEQFRFLHISTDEVYGSLRPGAAAFRETDPYRPNSPYAASKAAADHLARAWHHTYGLPVVTSNCSNNYGPYQFPEKLIPLMIAQALANKPLPLYGDGLYIRDWLYVSDHCAALRRILALGKTGETYNIGGGNQMTDLAVVQTLCDLLDALRPRADGQSYRAQISFVADRPGHDRRYAIDASKLESELGWKPAEAFAGGIRKTVQWYLDNGDWIADSMRQRETA